MKKRLASFAALALALSLDVMAESWQAQSSDKQIAVLELFTAEGCGNCPAADRWVEALGGQGITDDELIVLAFHVDYLDDKKGWVDRFAAPIFSERQKQLARLNLYQTVYTPEVFVSGELVHNWQEHGVELIRFVNSFKPTASISLAASRQAKVLTVDTDIGVDKEENRLHSKLYLAVTENNLINDIAGGDNRGTVFHHQHVMRKWLGPFELDKDGQTRLKIRVNLDENWKQQDLNVVAVIQNLYDGYVLQGLKLPLAD